VKKRCLLWTAHWRRRQGLLEPAYLHRFDSPINDECPDPPVKLLGVPSLSWTNALDGSSARNQIDDQHNQCNYEQQVD
jgi:hypothetical protein